MGVPSVRVALAAALVWMQLLVHAGGKATPALRGVSHSYSRHFTMATGEDGKMHSTVDEDRDVTVSDGKESRSEEYHRECKDGQCTEHVSPHQGRDSFKLEDEAPLIGGLSASADWDQDPMPMQGMHMPSMQAMEGMQEDLFDESMERMQHMQEALMKEMHSAEADSDIDARERGAKGALNGDEVSESDSVSRSVTISDINGEHHSKDVTMRCHNGKCTTTESESGDPAKESPGSSESHTHNAQEVESGGAVEF